MSAAPFRGVFTIPSTPFKANGEILWADLRPFHRGGAQRRELTVEDLLEIHPFGASQLIPVLALVRVRLF